MAPVPPNPLSNSFQLEMANVMRMQEYAVHVYYAHIHEYTGADENLIHIVHI